GPQQFVQLALGPLMHAGGQWSTLGTLLGGGKVVLYPHRHMDLARVLDLVERERVISLNLVGDAHAVPLLEVLRANTGRWDTSSLRLLGSGGSMLSGHAKEGLLAALPTVLAISEAVGSSEAPVEAISITTRAAAPAARRCTPRRWSPSSRRTPMSLMRWLSAAPTTGSASRWWRWWRRGITRWRRRSTNFKRTAAVALPATSCRGRCTPSRTSN